MLSLTGQDSEPWFDLHPDPPFFRDHTLTPPDGLFFMELRGSTPLYSIMGILSHQVNVMNLSISGFWTTKAGDYDPRPSLKTPISDDRFFYRISHDSDARQKVIVEILVDGIQVGLVHDWLSKDGKETFFFDVPLKLRTPGAHSLVFRIFAPLSADADAKQGEKIYESPTFSIEYTD